MNNTVPTSLKAKALTRQPKYGHYAGEFLTPGLGHILTEANYNFVLGLDALRSKTDVS